MKRKSCNLVKLKTTKTKPNIILCAHYAFIALRFLMILVFLVSSISRFIVNFAFYKRLYLCILFCTLKFKVAKYIVFSWPYMISYSMMWTNDDTKLGTSICHCLIISFNSTLNPLFTTHPTWISTRMPFHMACLCVASN